MLSRKLLISPVHKIPGHSKVQSRFFWFPSTLLNALTDIITNWRCSKPTQVNSVENLWNFHKQITNFQEDKFSNSCTKWVHNLGNRSRFSAASCSLCFYRSFSLRSSFNSLSICVMAILFQMTFVTCFLCFILRFSGNASICFIYVSCSSPKYFSLKSKKVISFCKLRKCFDPSLAVWVSVQNTGIISVLSFGACRGQATEIGKSCFSPSLLLLGFWWSS